MGENIVRVEQIQPFERSFRAARQPKPDKWSRVRAYRSLWCSLPRSLRQQLWAAYGNNRERYYLSYQPTAEDFIYYQETGMEAFVRMERRLVARMRVEPYRCAGSEVIKSLGAALSGCALQEHPNVVFMALDFEGMGAKSGIGISEIGIAKLQSCQIWPMRGDKRIACFNYVLKKHKNRKFMFGNTTRLSPELMKSTVIENLNGVYLEDPDREIILVGHNIFSEIRTMDDLGISLEALPVTAIIDTCHLASEILGFSGSLGHLLTTLRIPMQPDLLHCAGKDAHHALQAMLALLRTQCPEDLRRLEKLARQELPQPPSWSEREEATDDWADHLQVGTYISSLN